MNTSDRERALFLTRGKRRRHLVCLNKLSTHRIMGELVDSKVLLKRAPIQQINGQRFDGSGTAPESLVGWRVFDRCVAPVAWCLGNPLAGYRLPGMRLPAIAPLIKTPTRAPHQRPMSRARRWRKGQPSFNRSGGPTN
jgi:hypothetical protein